MVENTKPKRVQVNLKRKMNKLIVDKTRVDEFEELSTLLRNARTFKINDFWRCQIDVPLLVLTINDNELIGWVLYLTDIGEAQQGMADVYYKGVVSSSKNVRDTTPFMSIVNTNDSNIVIISLGGYASFIKPKIY